MWRANRALLVILSLLMCSTLSVRAASPVEPAAFDEPNAAVVNLTERDLNGLLHELFATAGGGHVSGETERISKGVYDLTYDAELGQPRLVLADDGRLSVHLEVQSADVRIGRIERRIGRRVARCENAGVSVDPGRPLELSFDVRFDVGPDGLRLIPESVRMDDARSDLRLIKPTRCENAVIPRWLLWWIGKSKFRRRMESLDDLLLARARSGAESLNGTSGLLAKSWETDGGALHLLPRTVDTARHSLLLALAAGSSGSVPADRDLPGWVVDRRDRSFLALKGSLLDRIAAISFPEGQPEPRKPSGPLRKLFRSRSLYTLIPGLRGLDTDEILFSLELTPPRLSLDSIDPSAAGIDPTLLGEPASDEARAALHIEFSEVQLKIWQVRDDERSVVGTLTIDSGRIAVAPYFSRIGGISFELLENEWSVSSSGVEFNEHVLAATLQEMVFGEIFETRFEPLARGALGVGDAKLIGRGFRVVDGYLIIEVGAAAPADPAPRQRDNLLALR